MLMCRLEAIDHDKATVMEVLKKLQENNINVSHLVERQADHCQQTESQTEKEVRHRNTYVVK
jgi:hypothetical protein